MRRSFALVRVPQHVAIIMDGNGRWAQRRGLPRAAGHRAGLAAVRMSIERCMTLGIGVLTIFAFSTENWRRPPAEVGLLMGLFLEALDAEIDELAAQGVAIRFVGTREHLAPSLVARMCEAEARTQSNDRLTLVIAIAYGGRHDIVEATKQIAREVKAGTLDPDLIDQDRFAEHLALRGLPDPDLLIRTGGDHRISNFLLWNLAYTELWFSDRLWPEFSADDFAMAVEAFGERERRFGLTPAQVSQSPC